jgi:tetratricopeptide (TPR) repeat protein
MATITAADVNKVRTITGAGMMDCKNALVEANGNFDLAIEKLRKKTQKDSSSKNIDSDIEKLSSYDYQGTIEDLTKAIQLDHNSINTYRNRAFEKAMQQDYHGAIIDCTKVIELKPKDALAYCNRGIAKIGLKDYNGAMDDYAKAREMNPVYSEYYNNKGIVNDIIKNEKVSQYYWFFNACSKLKKLDLKEDDYANQVIRICDEFNRNVTRFYVYIHDILCDAFLLKKEYGRAIQELDNIINELIGDNPNLWKYYAKKAKLHLELGNVKKAINSYKIAHHVCNDNVEKIDLNKELQKLISEYNDKFIELPYQQRQWVVINDNEAAISDTFVVFEKYNLPLTLNFPPRHPLTKEFYIGHPFVNSSYIPFSEYDESLFIDRYDEFKLFVQCLGAKSMTIEVIKGSESSLSIVNNRSSNNSSSISGSASVGYGAFGGNLSGSSSNSSNSGHNSNRGTQEDLQTSRATIQRFNPTKKPYLSSKLIWFNNEPTWQRLYEQRMAGSMLHHAETWSSKSNYSISEKEESNLKKAFKDFISGDIGVKLFSAKAEVNTDSNLEIDELVEKTFNKSESIEWSIKIEFEPIENLLVNNIESEPIKTIADTSSTSNKDEEEYLEEIKFMLEDDGVIDDKERSILERFRARKGISKERAIELEKNLLSFGNLLEDEKEYLEEFQEIFNDGEITEKERRILSRMANRLGISETRVKELERLN